MKSEKSKYREHKNREVCYRTIKRSIRRSKTELEYNYHVLTITMEISLVVSSKNISI